MQLTAGDKVAAVKIVQKTWITAVSNISDYSGTSTLTRWLLSILVDCSRDYYHKEKEYMLIDNSFNEFLPSPFPGFKNKQVTMDFERALRLLPVGYRHVFILHDVYNYKHNEIGDLLRINERASTNLLYKARKALRQLSGEINPSKAKQCLEWSKSEIKTFRSAYDNVALPVDLKAQVTRQLYSSDMIAKGYPRFSLKASIEQAMGFAVVIFAGLYVSRNNDS
jgi:RNA polymerase sigma-70 factor (ECF subfamily)